MPLNRKECPTEISISEILLPWWGRHRSFNRYFDLDIDVGILELNIKDYRLETTKSTNESVTTLTRNDRTVGSLRALQKRYMKRFPLTHTT